MSNKESIDSLSYEQARDKLADIVTKLEQGTNTLDESLELWQLGEALAAKCEQYLISAREKLDKTQGNNVNESD